MTPDLPHFPTGFFWDRQGRPIADFMDWALKFEDASYRVVAVDTIGGFTVSTVWTGIDAGAVITGRTPMIFETAVFDDASDNVIEGEKSTSEDAALEGHCVYVARTHAGMLDARNGHV